MTLFFREVTRPFFLFYHDCYEDWITLCGLQCVRRVSYVDSTGQPLWCLCLRQSVTAWELSYCLIRNESLKEVNKIKIAHFSKFYLFLFFSKNKPAGCYAIHPIQLAMDDQWLHLICAPNCLVDFVCHRMLAGRVSFPPTFRNRRTLAGTTPSNSYACRAKTPSCGGTSAVDDEYTNQATLHSFRP